MVKGVCFFSSRCQYSLSRQYGSSSNSVCTYLWDSRHFGQSDFATGMYKLTFFEYLALTWEANILISSQNWPEFSQKYPEPLFNGLIWMFHHIRFPNFLWIFRWVTIIYMSVTHDTLHLTLNEPLIFWDAITRTVVLQTHYPHCFHWIKRDPDAPAAEPTYTYVEELLL